MPAKRMMIENAGETLLGMRCDGRKYFLRGSQKRPRRCPHFKIVEGPNQSVRIPACSERDYSVPGGGISAMVFDGNEKIAEAFWVRS